MTAIVSMPSTSDSVAHSDLIRSTASRVRAEAELFAGSIGYDPESLWLMCGIVSSALVTVLRRSGVTASIAVGKFWDGEDAHWHFWVLAGNRNAALSWLVDLTATQFGNWERVVMLAPLDPKRESWRCDSVGESATEWLNIGDADDADRLVERLVALPGVSTPSGASLLATLQALGADATDLLLAAHEAAHAFDLGIPSMSPHVIDAAIMRLPPERRLNAEITAHAVGNVVCADLGVACQSIQESVWMALVAFIKAGDPFPCAAEFEQAIREAMETPRVRELADRVIALATGRGPRG